MPTVRTVFMSLGIGCEKNEIKWQSLKNWKKEKKNEQQTNDVRISFKSELAAKWPLNHRGNNNSINFFFSIFDFAHMNFVYIFKM